MSAVIPAAAKGTPLPKPDGLAQLVDLTTGALSPHGLQLMSAFRAYMVGGNRITPCSASGTDFIILQPNTAFPILEKYIDYEVFAFTAANTSTGSVTATVVPVKGALATLKVYKTNGAAQAGAGDVVANSVYLLVYADHLDAGAGGMVLK